nr:cell shape-determining protein MreC [Vibrio paracholerae]
MANSTLNAVSFDSSLHSFWRWMCVCLFRQMCLKNHC